MMLSEHGRAISMFGCIYDSSVNVTKYYRPDGSVMIMCWEHDVCPEFSGNCYVQDYPKRTTKHKAY